MNQTVFNEDDLGGTAITENVYNNPAGTAMGTCYVRNQRPNATIE